jgi:hypothetical protein
MADHDKRLQWSLLLLRLTVFLVMFMWTIDKFVNPGHAGTYWNPRYAAYYDTLEVWALTDIAPGEEITHDYQVGEGDGFWGTPA